MSSVPMYSTALGGILKIHPNDFASVSNFARNAIR
jgi:hypothetical protein